MVSFQSTQVFLQLQIKTRVFRNVKREEMTFPTVEKFFEESANIFP